MSGRAGVYLVSSKPVESETPVTQEYENQAYQSPDDTKSPDTKVAYK